MQIIKKLLELEHKFAWSIVGVILALLFGSVTTYIGFFYHDSPYITFELLANTNVVDVREEIDNLEILYNGDDIRKKGMTLSLITLRVINEGSAPVLKGYYDSKAPLGFALNEGHIIQHEVIDASNDYILRNLRLNLLSRNQLVFSNIIIEPKDYFLVKTLILHPKKHLLNLTPIGKIASIKRINFKHIHEHKTDSPLLSRIFAGEAQEQIGRLITYGICFFLISILFFWGIIAIILAIGKQRRRTAVINFKKSTNLKPDEQDEFIFQSYIRENFYFLEMLAALLHDEQLISPICSIVEKNTLFERPLKPSDEPIDFPNHLASPQEVVETAIKRGFVKKTNGYFSIEQHGKNSLQNFMRFLINRNMLSISECYHKKFMILFNYSSDTTE